MIQTGSGDLYGENLSMKPLCTICLINQLESSQRLEDDYHQTVLDLLDETACHKEVLPGAWISIPMASVSFDQ